MKAHRRNVVIVVLVGLLCLIGPTSVGAAPVAPNCHVNLVVGCYDGTHLGYAAYGATAAVPSARLTVDVTGSFNWSADTFVPTGNFTIYDGQAVPYGYYELQGIARLFGTTYEEDSASWSGWCGTDIYTPCDEWTEWSEWILIQDWTWDDVQQDYFRVWERYKYDGRDLETICQTERRVEWQGFEEDECIGDRVEAIPEVERGPWELVGTHVEDGITYEDYRRPFTRDRETGTICSYEFMSVPISRTHSVAAHCRSNGHGEILVTSEGPNVVYATIYWPDKTDELAVSPGNAAASVSTDILHSEIAVPVRVVDGENVEEMTMTLGPCNPEEDESKPCYARIRFGVFHDVNRDGLWDDGEPPLRCEVSASLSGAAHPEFRAPTGHDGWTGWYVDTREDRGFVITTPPECQLPGWVVSGYVLKRNDNGKIERFPPELIPLPVARCDQKQLGLGLYQGVLIPELGAATTTGAYANDAAVGEIEIGAARFDLYEARFARGTVVPLTGALVLHNGRLFGHESDLRGLLDAGTEVTIYERGNVSSWTVPSEVVAAAYGDALALNNDLPDIVTCNASWTGIEIYELDTR